MRRQEQEQQISESGQVTKEQMFSLPREMKHNKNSHDIFEGDEIVMIEMQQQIK